VLSFQIEFEDSDERQVPYGKKPLGQTDATAQGLFDSMMAYSGRYRMQGDDCFVTTVDSAWQPAWLGTDQVRFFNINGEMLSVMGPFREDRRYPGRRFRGVLTGRKDWS